MDDEELVCTSMMFLLICYYYSQILDSQTRRWWVRPINLERSTRGSFVNIFRHIKDSDHEMFFKYTRISVESFNKLLSILRTKLRKGSRREYLCPELRLAMILKYLAHGGSFQNLSWEFRVGHSTVSKVIYETCEIIWNTLQPLVMSLPNSDEWLDISHAFYEKWNFPNTLGAIDGKHVHIQCPINSGSLYYNYKNHFSLVLLACCDADYKFIWVDIDAYGSEHDAGVFRHSQMGQDLMNETVKLPTPQNLPGSDKKLSYFFIGDEAFPLRHYLMRPYPGKHLEEKKLIFNYRLSRARRVIENAFGILASRWRVYRQPLLCSVKTAESIVGATTCLHNFLRSEKENQYIPANYADIPLLNGNISDGEWRNSNQQNNFTSVGRVGSNISTNDVYRMRDTISDYLISDPGSVPWQLHIVRRGKLNRN